MLVAACVSISFAIAIYFFDGRSYRMILKPSEGGAVVQFLNPDWHLHTEEVPVDIVADRPWSVDITQATVPIPGVTIDFQDDTLRPGTLKIRIGSVKFELVELSYTVNGRKRSWLKDLRPEPWRLRPDFRAGLPWVIAHPGAG